MDDEPLDRRPDVEEVTAELVEGGWVQKEELCVQLGIEREMLELCIQWEIVHPSHVNLEGAILFSGQVIDRLSTGLRLHRDLGVNWAGVSVALDLLNRIEELEQRLNDLSNS